LAENNLEKTKNPYVNFTGNPLPIKLPLHQLYPTTSVQINSSVEANFGTDSAKPFEYDIDKCPGMVFE
jgi:hypothetical protein